MREHIIKTLQDPQSLTAEDYRVLRTNIKFASIDSVVKLILVTSAGPREGKSSVVANLAVSMALAGKSVLIIDADLRNPTQHKIFGISNLTGLTTTLAEDGFSISYIVKTPNQGLDILPSGPIPPNPAELLDSRRMKQVLLEVMKYDYVLIDSPPVIPVSDASILAQLADGVIMVLAAGEVEKEYALRAKEQLEKVGAKILGMVLNKVKMESKKNYFYYQYGSQKTQAHTDYSGNDLANDDQEKS